MMFLSYPITPFRIVRLTFWHCCASVLFNSRLVFGSCCFMLWSCVITICEFSAVHIPMRWV